ncbi:hypothetical protein FCULG_00009260 [Fusarium culmorum]|uniref:Uncharacterized protein n=1 Tax=Fusarium culmorum TaxID=5516 RepID=A0A2T4GGM8_FUSCU|nr:hypothetical protein FCULG_00009260 [Fusarium culmorum]
MEKVWFKLRQTDHYPPSEDTILLGDGDDLEATLCLGHYVSDLKNIDFPLNRGSILPFPRRMTGSTQDCLDQEELKAYVKGKSFWSMFMITGIKVARAGTRETREENGVFVDIGPQLTAFGLASLIATTNHKRSTSKTASGNYTRDFIWAIRLAKVHKGLLMRDWSVAAHTRRATFGDKEGDADIESALKGEGLEEFQIIDDNALDEVIVLNEQFI